MVDLLQDPGEPEVLYALTATNGVFRSPNSGATWERANAGLPPEVSDFAAAGSGVLYAVHRSSATVWRTLDDGASWEATGSAIPGGLLAWGVAADGTAPGNLWVAAQEGEGTRLFTSDDFGDHWTPAGSHPSTALDLAATPSLPGTIFLSPLHGGYVVRTDDNGLTWTPMYYARHWRQLAVDVQDPSRLLSLRQSPPSVYESLDGGTSWHLLAELAEPLGYEARAIAIDPTDGDRLTAVFRNNLWESTDGGLTWARSEPIDPLLDLTDLVVVSDTASARMLLTPEGIYRGSSGYGRLGVRGLEARASAWIWSAAEKPRVVAAGGLGSGPWLSVNAGARWRPRTRSLLAHGVWNTAFAGTPDGSTLYLGQGGDLWRSRLGGPWTPLGVDLPLGNIAVVDVLPSGRILIADTGDHHIAFASDDAGASWTSYYTAPEPDDYYPLEVSVDPTDESRGLVAALGYGGTCFVDRTTDGGATWNRVLDEEIPYFYCGVLRIEWDRASDAAYLLVRRTTPRPNDPNDFELLLRSLDGGATWEPIGDELPCFGALAVDPASSDVYVGCDGLYVSHDRGLSWEPFDGSGLPADLRYVQGLAAILGTHGVTLHAATNAGAYSYTLAESRAPGSR